MAERLAPHTAHTSATRLNVLIGQRNVRFERRSGLDALAGVQDVAVGTDLGLTLGRSVPVLSTGENQPVDLYSRLRVFAGAAPSTLVLNSALTVEGRNLVGGVVDGGWKDVIGEVDALLYWQPAALDAHTFLLRVGGAGGWSMQEPFQLTLGGPAGLRGYRDPDFPAGRRLLVSVEDRIYVRWPLPDLVDLGFTLFADAGRGWAGDVPFAEDSGWRGTAGGGLRIGFPAGSGGVVRVDLAFPLGPDTAPSDAVLRVGLRDAIGVIAGFESRQLARSRRVNVGPDRFTERERR
jgi:hypothetical protein